MEEENGRFGGVRQVRTRRDQEGGICTGWLTALAKSEMNSSIGIKRSYGVVCLTEREVGSNRRSKKQLSPR